MSRAAHREGIIGGPCHTIKSDGFWCMKPATQIVGRYGYCTRHARTADGKGYAPQPKGERAR